MKFKEQRGNVFVFDVDGAEVECTLTIMEGGDRRIDYGKVKVFQDLCVEAEDKPFSTIQTAVQMMKILIDRGLV